MDYWDILRRRIWWLLGTGCLLGIVGFSLSLLFPKEYVSHAVIESKNADGSATLTSEVFTDSELEEIVKREHMMSDPGIRSISQAIGLVQDQAKIRSLGGKSFLVTYSAKDRHVAQKVNESLVSLLVERGKSLPNPPHADGTARGQESEDAKVAVKGSETQTTGLRVLEPPTLPLESSRPQRVGFLVIGFLFGTGLGAMAAIVQAKSDDRIKNERDLIRLTDFPVLASIPKISAPDEFKNRR